MRGESEPSRGEIEPTCGEIELTRGEIEPSWGEIEPTRGEIHTSHLSDCSLLDISSLVTVRFIVRMTLNGTKEINVVYYGTSSQVNGITYDWISGQNPAITLVRKTYMSKHYTEW